MKCQCFMVFTRKHQGGISCALYVMKLSAFIHKEFTTFYFQRNFCFKINWFCVSTWNTVRRDCGKLSKVLRFVCVSSKLNLPPKSCIPKSEKMIIKRKSSSSSEAMDRMEFSNEATRLLSDCQCLAKQFCC